jgi:hypothetical protein
MNPPMMTPRIAIVIAIFMPLKIAGKANGRRTIRKVCHCAGGRRDVYGNAEPLTASLR